jgi:hypothetical protein
MLTFEQAMEIFKKRDTAAILYAKQKREKPVPTIRISRHPLKAHTR